MPRILNKELLVIVALTLLVLSGVIVHSHYFNRIGRISTTKPAGKNQPEPLSVNGDSFSMLYLTQNISISPGTTSTIDNQHVVLQSISATSIGISVYGKLDIMNSTITISSAPYSTVKDFALDAHNGSVLDIFNSSIVTPGSFSFNGTNVTIQDSNINSTKTSSNGPRDNALTIQVNNSHMKVVNSTIEGLYSQNSPLEYRDGGLYLYESGFSQSATVPTKVSSYRVNDSYINSAEVNVTYQGASNETVNSLEVYYNNSYLTSLMLPYTYNETSRQENFTVNFTGTLHNLSWMENTSHFRLVANISYSTAIALSNMTVGLMSNDTVDLYGQKYYSYNINNSTALFFNSSLGLNENSYAFDSGEPNFNRLSMSALNSTIFLGDTSLAGEVTYSQPFFSLDNSSLYLFREIDVNTSYRGIPYSGAIFTLQPSNYGPAEISAKSFVHFRNEINSTGFKWLNQPKELPALYETANNGSDWNYTYEFTLSASPGNMSVSLNPFPYLPGTPYVVNYRLPVPYADFSIEKNILNFTGNVTVDFSGNLACVGNLNLYWNLYRNNSLSDHGIYRFNYSSLNSTIPLPLHSMANITYGNYTLKIDVQSTSLHVFRNASNLTVSFSIPAPVHPITVHRKILYNIREVGLSGSRMWGLNVNGTEYFSTSSTISVANASGQKITVIAPYGDKASTPMINLSLNETNYTLEFSKIYYTLSFKNNIPNGGIEWSVTVNGNIYTTSNRTLELKLLPGSYNFVVHEPSGYTASNTSGIVNLTSGPVNISVVSLRHFSIESVIVGKLANPYYYTTLLGITIASIAFLVRRRYHTWYVCEKCGATRESKKAECPSCNLQEEPEETIFWDEDWD